MRVIKSMIKYEYDYDMYIENLKEENEELKRQIIENKYNISRLKKEKRKKFPIDWGHIFQVLFLCNLGFHVWGETQDNGTMRECERCGLIHRRQYMAPDGFLSGWEDLGY